MTRGLSTEGIHSVFAAIRSTPIPLKYSAGEERHRPARFITISRQGGAGGRTIGQRLVARLNELDPGETPWTLWDRQLVEKVSADHHISREVVDSLEDTGKTWLQEFLAGLSFQGDETEARVYQRVAATIRLLAQQARAVIVGRGGVYITRNMAGGAHLRLVAPFDYRVKAMAAQLGLDRSAAEEHIRHLDKSRQAFYRRYWPQEALEVETFTLTVNTAVVEESRAVEGILPFVLPGIRVAEAGNSIAEAG